MRGRLAGWLRGPESQPRWARPGLLALLTMSAVIYLWGLWSSGWGNEFYAAAAQAGAQDWTAWLFGSVDAGNAITVDKPPASLWVMGLSARLFGVNYFAIMLPQALMGVASVGVLAATVRRTSGPAAGLLAGAVLAATPVATLMFRYDNPDALLVLLLVAATYCAVRATESASTRWLALAGVAIGFAFLTKMMQAFLVLPGLASMFLIAAPASWWVRVRALLVAGVAVVVSGGWFIALVALWPQSARPYIGGSTDNSLWQLAVGYNGLGRIVGGSGNGGGGGGHFPGGSGPGITRLFAAGSGTEISWLLPVALLGLLAGLWYSRRAPRTDRLRAALIAWGGWLLVTGLVFSYMSGIFHDYYTIALAPAVAALVGIGVTESWRRRTGFVARAILAAMAALTAVWTFVLLDRTPDWLPWLRWVLLIGGLAVALTVLLAGHVRTFSVVIAAAALLFGLTGTTAYTLDTVARPHSGGIVTSGPGADTNPMSRFGAKSDESELYALLAQTNTRWSAATVSTGSAASMELHSGTAVIGIGGFMGSDPAPSLARFQQYVSEGNVRYFVQSSHGMGARFGDADHSADPPPASPGDTTAGAGMPDFPANGGSPFDRESSSSAAEISAWVKAHFESFTVGDNTVYDLNHPTHS